MGAQQSSGDKYEDTKERPDSSTEATLYYFAGRGLADQIRFKYDRLTNVDTLLSYSSNIIDGFWLLLVSLLPKKSLTLEQGS